MAATKFIFRKAGEAGYVEEAKSSVEFQSVEVTSALTVPAPALDMHAATKKYVDDKAIEIRGINDATSEQVAYSIENLRKYVDENIQGLDVKASVRAMSTSNVALAAGGRSSLSMDGVSLAENDRVLLVGQTSAAENGIYVVGADWSLSRAADASDVGDSMPGELPGIDDVTVGMFTFVEEGTANAASGWVLSAASANPIVLDTTELTFTQFSGAGMVLAGAGLTKTGNQLDIGGSNSITVNADSIELNYKASEALAVNGADGLEVVIAEGSPITKDGGLDLTVGTGVAVTSGSLDLAIDANQPFTKASGLKLEFSSGLELIDDGGQKELDLKIDSAQPFTKASGLKMEFASGLELIDNDGQKELDLKIDSEQPFTKASGLKLEYDSGLLLNEIGGQKRLDIALEFEAPFSKVNGLKLELQSLSGLDITANKLSVQTAPEGGLWLTSGTGPSGDASVGVAVRVASEDELYSDSDGLWVKGVPAEFKIGGTATSTNVTAAALGQLTGDLDGNDLHFHMCEKLPVYPDATLTAGCKKMAAIDPTTGQATVATIEGASATAKMSIGVAVGTQNWDPDAINLVRSGRIQNFFTSGSSADNYPVYVKDDGSIVPYASLNLPGSGSYRLVRAGFRNGPTLIVDIMDLGEVVL